VGVRSSGKDETRRYRVEFYLDQLTTARLQVAFYEEMLRLEERKDNIVAARSGLCEVECADLEAEMRVLRLREHLDGLRETGVGAGKQAEKAKMKAEDETPAKDEDEWTGYDELMWRKQLQID